MDPLRPLKFKTGALRRLLKELRSYEEEVVREQEKTERMKAAGADPYDLKQQENVLAESRAMIPDCGKRIESVYFDLQGVLGSLDDALKGSSEAREAEEFLAQTQVLVKN